MPAETVERHKKKYLWCVLRFLHSFFRCGKSVGKNTGRRKDVASRGRFEVFFLFSLSLLLFVFPCEWKTLVEKARKVEKNRQARPLFHFCLFLELHTDNGGHQRKSDGKMRINCVKLRSYKHLFHRC